MMQQPLKLKGVNDLVRWLGHVEAVHEQLLTLVRSKIDAMRAADVGAMRALAERERSLVQRLQRRQRLREKLMDKLGEDLSMAPGTARSIGLSQLAARLPHAQKDRLLGAGEALRRVMAQVAQANRVAGAVSREVVTHLRWVFGAVRPTDDGSSGYGVDGESRGPVDVRIFEAVG